jgi:hypothetical protein
VHSPPNTLNTPIVTLSGFSDVTHPLVRRPFPFTAALSARREKLTEKADPGEDARDDHLGSSCVPVTITAARREWAHMGHWVI